MSLPPAFLDELRARVPVSRVVAPKSKAAIDEFLQAGL